MTGVFDPVIFDPDVFDTGEESAILPFVPIWNNSLTGGASSGSLWRKPTVKIVIADRLWQTSKGSLKRAMDEVHPTMIINLSAAGAPEVWPTTVVDFPIRSNRLPNAFMLTGLVGLITYNLRLGGRVLVYCASGSHRASLITSLVLRSFWHITGEEAIKRLARTEPQTPLGPKYGHYVRSLAMA